MQHVQAHPGEDRRQPSTEVLEAVAEHTLGWEHYLARLQAASAGGDRAGTHGLTTRRHDVRAYGGFLTYASAT